MEELPRFAYRVRRSSRGSLEWIEVDGDSEIVHHRQPDVGVWRRVAAGLYRLLPIDEQL